MMLHVLLGASLVAGSLTPAKTSDVQTNSAALGSTKAPKVIYVDAFSISGASSQAKSEDGGESGGGILGNRPRIFGGDGPLGRRREEQHEETLDKLPGQFQRALVADLNKAIAPATAGDGSGADSHGWVITGRFVVVDAGNKALQAGVGLGAGQSEIQVEAKVAVVGDDDAFLSFDSQKASGHMPGAIMMHNPYVVVAKLVMSKKQPEKEAKKIAQSIADEIGKFMAAHGIPTKKSTSGNASGEKTSEPAASSKGSRSVD